MAELKLSFAVSVHSSERQALVHAGALLVRRLLHHPAVLRLHLPGQDMDW